MLRKYGVTCGFLTEACINARQNNTTSNINLTFIDYLQDVGMTNIQTELHLGRYYYDIYLPDINTIIELNPTISHTCIETGIYLPREEYYHYFKTKYAQDNGYRCINVWDWDNWSDIISMIMPKEKLYARKLQLKEISKQEANIFLNEYHLQNSCRGNSVNIGLFDNDNQLIQVMTFGKPRYNKNYQWELLRLCSHSSYIVIGGAERLFKYFIKNYNPESIISYCDLSKFSGSVYERLGFTKYNIINPSKIWSKDSEHITQNLLNKYGFDILIGSKLSPPELYGKGTDNNMLMLSHKWLPVYDCGQQMYNWKIKT